MAAYLIALLLAGMMMLLVTACGEGEKAPVDDMKNPAGETQKQEEPKESMETESTESENLEELAEGPLVLVQQSNLANYYRKFIYAEEGRIVKEQSYSKTELTEEYIYNYTEQADGKTLCVVYQDDPDNKIYELTYDASGNCVRKLKYYPENGNNYTTSTFEYDAAGRLICYGYVEIGGNSGDVVTYTYDENGNMLMKQKAAYTNGNVYSTTTYTYNEDGDVCKSERSSSSYGDKTEEYTWNYTEGSGTLVKEEESTGQKYTYEYDKNGNVLSMMVEDPIAVLPAQLYVKEGHLVDLCEYSDFVLMPLSRALALQNP